MTSHVKCIFFEGAAPSCSSQNQRAAFSEMVYFIIFISNYPVPTKKAAERAPFYPYPYEEAGAFSAFAPFRGGVNKSRKRNF